MPSVLVHGDRFYGVPGPIERIVFDIVETASSWRFYDTVTSNGGVASGPLDIGVSVRVRPVTADFDPAAVTWAVAAGLTYGAQVTMPVVAPGAVNRVWVEQESFGGEAAHGWVVGDVEIPGMMMFKERQVGWNALATIYGWELSIRVDGVDDQSVRWTGDAADADTVSYTILL